MPVSKRPIHIYESIIALYIMTLIVSNIASVKLVGAGSLIFDAGTILFPLSYILSDIITEIYGFRKMRAILLIGIVMLALTSLTFWIVGAIPAISDWPNQGAYDTILGVVPRIVLGSITAIFIGELLNAFVLAKMKIATKGSKLWYRLIGSSAIGNAADTVTFSLIAFAGTISGSQMLTLIATVYGMKMATEIVLSPLTMHIIRRIKRVESLDTYEEPHLFTRSA